MLDSCACLYYSVALFIIPSSISLSPTEIELDWPYRDLSIEKLVLNIHSTIFIPLLTCILFLDAQTQLQIVESKIFWRYNKLVVF